MPGSGDLPYLNRIPSYPRTLYLRIRNSNFGRHVLILTGGTVIARALVVLASPLLTRIYLPADFGVLSVFFSLVTATVTISSLNYEAAIPLPKDNEFGLNVMGVSFAVLFLNTLLCAAVVIFLARPLTQLIRTPQLEPYLWLLPLSLLGGGTFQVLNSWSVRVQDFRSLAKRRVIQAAGQVVTQLAVPLFLRGPFGLLLGDSVGRAGGCLALAIDARKYAKQQDLHMSAKKFAEAAVRYKRFPFFGTASVLVHSSFHRASCLTPDSLLRSAGSGMVWVGQPDSGGRSWVSRTGHRSGISQQCGPTCAQLTDSAPRIVFQDEPGRFFVGSDPIRPFDLRRTFCVRLGVWSEVDRSRSIRSTAGHTFLSHSYGRAGVSHFDGLGAARLANGRRSDRHCDIGRRDVLRAPSWAVRPMGSSGLWCFSAGDVYVSFWISVNGHPTTLPCSAPSSSFRPA